MSQWGVYVQRDFNLIPLLVFGFTESVENMEKDDGLKDDGLLPVLQQHTIIPDCFAKVGKYLK